jgi:hypothetical protein
MLIVPLSNRDQLTSEGLPPKRDLRDLLEDLFQCQDESFYHGDAAVHADSAVSRRADALPLYPPPERLAVEDAVTITHEVFGCRPHAT